MTLIYNLFLAVISALIAMLNGLSIGKYKDCTTCDQSMKSVNITLIVISIITLPMRGISIFWTNWHSMGRCGKRGVFIFGVGRLESKVPRLREWMVMMWRRCMKMAKAMTSPVTMRGIFRLRQSSINDTQSTSSFSFWWVVLMSCLSTPFLLHSQAY